MEEIKERIIVRGKMTHIKQSKGKKVSLMKISRTNKISSIEDNFIEFIESLVSESPSHSRGTSSR